MSLSTIKKLLDLNVARAMEIAGIQQDERKQHRKGQGEQKIDERPKTAPGEVTDKSSQKKKRAEAWDEGLGWLEWAVAGRGEHSEGCGRTGPRSESRRAGPESLGQPPRRSGHAGATVTGEGQGRTEGGKEQAASRRPGRSCGAGAASGALLTGAMRFKCAVRGLPAPARPAAPGSDPRAGRAATMVAPALRGRERAREKKSRRAGRVGPDRSFPRSPRRDSVPGPAPPPSRPAGPGRAGPGQARLGQASLRHNTAASLHSPASRVPQSQSHVRPPLPPPPGPDPPPPPPGAGIAEVPPLAAAPPRLTAGGGSGLTAARAVRARWGWGLASASASASGGVCQPS